MGKKDIMRNCEWMQKIKDSRLEQYCPLVRRSTKTKEEKKLGEWCPDTCGRVGLGECKESPQSDEPSNFPTMTLTKQPTVPSTKSPTKSPTAAPPPSECKDSTESFLFNTKRDITKNCEWMQRIKDSRLEQYCPLVRRSTETNEEKKLGEWCPETCGRVGLGECEKSMQPECEDSAESFLLNPKNNVIKNCKWMQKMEDSNLER